eukprot:Sdes_comp8999_c0_seq1m417
MFHVPASKLVAASFCIAISTFLLILFFSLLFDFEGVNGTVCQGFRVYNVFPSISAASGRQVQRYIWRMGIAMILTLRLLDGFIYYDFFTSAMFSRRRRPAFLNLLALILHSCEVFSLALLTYVSSSDNYTTHKIGFITFMTSATLHMYLHLYLYTVLKPVAITRNAKRSLFLKKLFVAVNQLSFLLAIYTYWHHVTYCQPFVYSLFGFLEWLTVFSNIGFHSVGYYDFSRFTISLQLSREFSEPTAAPEGEPYNYLQLTSV